MKKFKVMLQQAQQILFFLSKRRESKNFQYGFTLVELLVAITIIAIIAAVGFSSYNTAQMRGRDAKRKQDLRSISIALELYYQQNKRYPETNPGGTWQGSGSGGFWITDLHSPAVAFNTDYINILPTDPNNASPFIYEYYSAPVNLNNSNSCKINQYYILRANLENDNDPDLYIKKQFTICGELPAGWCNTLTCKYFIIAGNN